MSHECIHSLGCKENTIGEKVTYCEIWGEWRNITLGDCFGNCESQDEEVTVTYTADNEMPVCIHCDHLTSNLDWCKYCGAEHGWHNYQRTGRAKDGEAQ